MRKETRVFEFIPLSPVHIGSGERMQLEEYFYAGEKLVRIDLGKLVSSLDEKKWTEMDKLIDRADLSGLRRWFSKIHKETGDRFVQYRIELGKSSKEDLRQLTENLQRKGEVHVLPRNPYTSDVLIPGSAIKGALRTAWLSYCLNQPENQRSIEQLLQRRDASENATKVATLAFPMSGGETERDPLRLLWVSDGEWTKDAVQIDKVALWKLGREAGKTSGIQAHYERLLSVADKKAAQQQNTTGSTNCIQDSSQAGRRAEPRQTLITISIEQPAHLSRKKLIRYQVDWPNLIYAANRFYEGRFQAEIARFDFLRGNHELWEPPDDFRQGEDMLIRVGRFCGFDSASVDQLRQSFNTQRKTPISEIGSTRTLCPVGAGKFVPFGWARLRRVD